MSSRASVSIKKTRGERARFIGVNKFLALIRFSTITAKNGQIATDRDRVNKYPEYPANLGAFRGTSARVKNALRSSRNIEMSVNTPRIEIAFRANGKSPFTSVASPRLRVYYPAD